MESSDYNYNIVFPISLMAAFWLHGGILSNDKATVTLGGFAIAAVMDAVIPIIKHNVYKLEGRLRLYHPAQ